MSCGAVANGAGGVARGYPACDGGKVACIGGGERASHGDPVRFEHEGEGSMPGHESGFLDTRRAADYLGLSQVGSRCVGGAAAGDHDTTVRARGTVYWHKASRKSYSESGSRRGRSCPRATPSGSVKAYRPVLRRVPSRPHHHVRGAAAAQPLPGLGRSGNETVPGFCLRR